MNNWSIELIRFLPRCAGPVSGLLLGVLAFFIFCGSSILDPGNIGWLLDGDPATHFLGWHFFRRSSWSLPLGSNPAYGLELASSIVYTDSIPVLAFLFKPFAAWLPDPFQYTGLWLLLCFALQGLCGALLLSRFTPNPLLQGLGAVLLLLSPPWLARIGHFALCGHWLILVALYLYLSSRFRYWPWLLLLTTAALVHAYLLVMVAAFWAANLLQRRLLEEITWRRGAATLLAGLGAVTVALWVAGYFSIGHNSVGGDGFGFYHLNLLAPLDSGRLPDQPWSALLRDLPQGPGDYEGFNYLGLGNLLLLLLASYELLRRFPTPNRRRAPLLGLAATLTLLALSHRIAWGDHELLRLPLPERLLAALQIFQSSGRLFWPVFYLAILTVLVLVIRRNRPPVALAVVSLALLLQTTDTAPGWRRLQIAYHHHLPVWQSPLQSPFWTAAAKRYQKIRYLPIQNAPPGYLPLALFAANHGLAINVGYFARLDQNKLMAANQNLNDLLHGGRLESGTLYITRNERYLALLLNSAQPQDGVGQIDGYWIIAPGWANCATCPTTPLNSVGDPQQRRAIVEGCLYTLGRPLTFQFDSAGARHLLQGWSDPEPWGVWSNGKQASLDLELTPPPSDDLRLRLSSHAMLPHHGRQQITVYGNGQLLGELEFTAEHNASVRELTVPAAALQPTGGLLLEFNVAYPTAPAELGQGDDPRPLGLGLIGLTLEAR